MNSLPVRFYLGYLTVLLVVIAIVEAIFGTLYARYVIIYTGAIFMGGLMAGHRYEQLWLARQRRHQEAGEQAAAPSLSMTTGPAGSRARQS